MSSPDFTLTLETGRLHHQAGRLADAEKIYRHILIAQPNHPVALHLLGVVAHQTGNNDAANDLIRRAIAIDPTMVDAHSNLGKILKEQGRLDEAIAA